MLSRAVTAGQVEAQQAAALFVSAYIAQEADRPATLPSIAGDTAGRTATGIPLDRVLASSLGGGLFALLRSGSSAPVAIGAAARAAAILAESEVAAAADREIANQARPEIGVQGWTWSLTGLENCAACLSRADGVVRPMDESMARHPGCDCVRSVRMLDDPRLVEHPTGEALFRRLSPKRQEQTFRTAGKEKAELVRSGQITLADLVKVERHTSWRTIVTERSLSEVLPAG